MAARALDELIAEVHRRARGDLERLSAAVGEAAALSELGDALIGHFVERARLAGHTWSQVGERLGVSKQAAHQRFVAAPGGPSAHAWRGTVRVGRRDVALDDSVRRAMGFALEEARELRHNYLGTEHILLGILRGEEGGAWEVLSAAGVDAAGVREAIVAIIGRGRGRAPSAPRMTPRAKRVLELAARETKRVRSRCVLTEHVLLALLREGEGVAAQILAHAGVTEEAVREAIASLDR